MKNTKLVYSTDPKQNQKCLSCGNLISECTCKTAEAKSANFVAVLCLEKSGRGGKTVTVIDGLPKQELFLKTLSKEMKSKCGVGGTYSTAGKEGIIEMQGDQRETVRKIFAGKGYKTKG